MYTNKQKSLCKAISLLLCAAFLLTGCSSAFSPSVSVGGSAQKAGTIYINEVMTSNANTYTDEYGATPDWIELYNASSKAVDLSGYGLSDNREKPYKFTFPKGTRIEAQGYLLVMAVGEEEDRGGLRAQFGLSKAGESVLLVNKDGVLLHEVSLPEIPTDISYGRIPDGTYAFFSVATPGTQNAEDYSQEPIMSTGETDAPIKINEIMPNNDYGILDADGDRSDWIELVNIGTETINLKGYALTDDLSNRKKWLLPEVSIGMGEYVLIFLSGKDRVDSELHANFSVGSDEDAVYLADPTGATIDTVKFGYQIPGNVSYGRNKDNIFEWLYYPTPTPGKINDTKGFTVIDQALALDGVYINEIKASDTPKSGKPDWIELYNNSGDSINLTGWHLSDNKNDPQKYTFPENTSISPGEYLTIETGRKASASNQLNADFGISEGGETVYLFRPDLTIADHFSSGYLKAGVTSGRAPQDRSGQRFFYTAATKGAANDSTALTAYAQAPTFSAPGGYIQDNVNVEIRAGENAEIFYTTDGSKPDRNSNRYNGPVLITDTATLRAIAYEPGKVESNVTSVTYLNEQRHDIPVVCIASDPDGLFSEETGIYANGPGYTEEFPHTGANFWKDWEREISFEFYEADGTPGVQFDAGLKIFGQYSRGEDQKSMAVYLRSAYGQSEVTYPFFRDYDVTTFSSLLLRTSGQDWYNTKIKDAFFAQAVKGVMDLDYMEYRPVALYINGQYWGLYNLREKVNESYISNHYDIDGYDIDMIKGNKNALTGDNDAFQELRAYMKSHDLSDQSVYDYVASQVDVENFMDYAILETYFNNTDTGNIKFWKPRSGEGKWRWIVFDMDWGLSSSTYQWNMIEEFFSDAGHGVGNAFYSHIQMGLLQNAGFRDAFYKRYAYHINNTFAPDRLCAIVDSMADEIRTEMPRHCARWNRPASADKWESNIEDFKQMIREKPEITIEDLQQTFNISDAKMRELFPDR